MPCTSCMKEYNRFRKENSCSKCGFGFCEKCLNRRFIIPPLSQKPVPVCHSCYSVLSGKAMINEYLPKEKFRNLPDNDGQIGTWGDEVPPSLRSLYSQNANKTTKKDKTKNEWSDLEERLQKLNEPIAKTNADNSYAFEANHKNDQSLMDLEERLALLRGVPVEIIRKPRLLVSDIEDDDDPIMMDEVKKLLQQGEEKARIDSQLLNPTDASNSSEIETNSETENRIIQQAIAKNDSNLVTFSESGPIYPNLAECIRKTIQDAAISERETLAFLHSHGQSLDEHPEIPLNNK